jgi:4-alpha-glucanotransferase
MGAARADEATVLKGCLAFLSASSARTLLVALEDLWLETEAQNVPGTSDEHPNWRRKARYALEEFRNAPEVVGILRDVNVQRKGTAHDARAR